MGTADGSTLVLRAARFACERHAGQSKPRQKRPVADHCLEVALLVSEAGQPPVVAAAALLHDTLEKTATTADELEAVFGPRIRALVEAVTDLPGESDETTRARLQRAPAEAQLIKCADIVSNLEALARAGELTGKDLSDKAATLQVLQHAEPSLAERAARIIARGTPGGAG
ncbi:HD domain-containing protein [Bradyrhizobium sp. LHD-71]|uniref:HD domain-containing protein n=1 Tax=Bradyrhizobium sp. LHD-71 TaxID=3072141 RepID=UPI0028109965|nr:HD domain-containing protein [Bradyrhizobium sp. LHD-71]MDQ8729361.1 HD domain-containing protein [Bradyrhizobium sp. LHD-71]